MKVDKLESEWAKHGQRALEAHAEWEKKVSVIIATIGDPHLVRTIDSLRENAGGELEFIVINDGGKPLDPIDDVTIIRNASQKGRRVSINNAAAMATGDYIFILDSHCSMTKDWDIKLAKTAGRLNIAYSVIRDMTPDTWEYRPGWYGHVRINKDYTEKWWRRKDPEFCEVEEESIAFTGCAWMISRKRFWQLKGYDESLGKYGWDGPEWALKTWLNKGRVILRTDVICGHIFGTNDKASMYPCEMIPKEQYVKYMKDRYEGKFIDGLIERFAPVPDWTEKVNVKRLEKPVGQKIKREIKVNRIDESITKNAEGVVIKKVIEYFEYIHTDNGNGPSEAEIAKKYGPKAKKVREEVWELKEGKLQKVA